MTWIKHQEKNGIGTIYLMMKDLHKDMFYMINTAGSQYTQYIRNVISLITVHNLKWLTISSQIMWYFHVLISADIMQQVSFSWWCWPRDRCPPHIPAIPSVIHQPLMGPIVLGRSTIRGPDLYIKAIFITPFRVNAGWQEIGIHCWYSLVNINITLVCACKNHWWIWHHNASVPP